MKLLGVDLEKRGAVIRGGFGLSHAPLTGNNRSPNPDFGQFISITNTAAGSPAGNSQDPGQPVRLTGNTPVIAGRPLFEQLGVTPDGLVTTNSIAIPAVADTGFSNGRGKVPYSQNWNVSLSFEPFGNTVVEVAYVANKGTHLYMPLVNINPRDNDFVELLEAQNLNAETAFNDPPGRRNLAGGVITIQRNSVQTPFFGFNNLNRFYDPSANSIRHAGYIDVRRRVARGFTFTANYTYGKSIDDASDANPDTRVITEVGQTQGHVSYGAPRSVNRSVSTFDIKHNFSSNFVLDFPFGRGRQMLKDAPGVVDAALGGWTMSGVFRLQGGTPFLPFLTDTNRLGGTNRTVRPNIVEGVPLVNPLWSEDCMAGATCEPYVNPSAFIRPPKGSLGNAPRTIDSLRAPSQEYLDLSFQKNFRWPFADNEEKRRINFRVDLINALNHPVFRLGSSGSAGFTTAVPSEALLTQAELNTWLAANPGRTLTLAQVNNLITGSRLPGGALPLDFFSVRVPQGFATRTPQSFDIATLEGLKLFRLRGAYDANFGSLRVVPNARYIQFGLRIFF